MPLTFIAAPFAGTTVPKLGHATPSQMNIRQTILMNTTGRAALAKGLRSYKCATISKDHVALGLDENDKAPLTMLPVEFRALDRHGLVGIEQLKLKGPSPALKTICPQGLRSIYFDACKSEDGSVVALINANADTLKKLYCPPLGMLFNTKTLTLDLLVIQRLDDNHITQLGALLRHSVKEIDLTRLGYCSPLAPRYLHRLPAEKLSLNGLIGSDLQIRAQSAKNDAVKHLKIETSDFEDNSVERFAALLQYYAVSLPNLEQFEAIFEDGRDWKVYYSVDQMKEPFVFLQFVEEALRRNPPAFKTSVRGRFQCFCCFRYRASEDPRTNLSERHILAEQSADLEKSGYGHQVFHYRPDLGTQVDYFVETKIVYEHCQ